VITIVEPIGLLLLKFKRDTLRADVKQKAMDRGFVTLLRLVSITRALSDSG
jgi:citrate/tricarballylate utilization protein